MVAIVNVGPVRRAKRPDARHYELRINRQVIAKFKHCRADGLAALLRAAAAAAEQARDMEMLELLTQIDST